MDIDVTVDVDPTDVLDRMDTKDIIEYLNDYRGCSIGETTGCDLKELAQNFEPMDILTAAAYRFLPRNCRDRQSVMDAIHEYLSRV